MAVAHGCSALVDLLRIAIRHGAAHLPQVSRVVGVHACHIYGVLAELFRLLESILDTLY